MARTLARATPTTPARVATVVVISVAFYGAFLLIRLRTDLAESPWYLLFVPLWLALGYVVGPILGAVLTGWYRERPLDLSRERLTWLGTRRYRATSAWASPLSAEEALIRLAQRFAIPSVHRRVLDGGLWLELERDIVSDVQAVSMGVRERAAVDMLVIVAERPTTAGTRTGSTVTVHHGRRRGWTAAPDGGTTARLADHLLLLIREVTEAEQG
ncbi:hypothetical protein V6N00_15230 [Tersicoccus sp. MR15.9]|uniref:hypothetical protein n=1 Tax=Tersicoccus mangrovi TaxID=3121635 RepID=UPI002FE6362D